MNTGSQRTLFEVELVEVAKSAVASRMPLEETLTSPLASIYEEPSPPGDTSWLEIRYSGWMVRSSRWSM